MLITPNRSRRGQHAVKTDIGSESRLLPIPHLHSNPPLGGSRFNIVMPFGVEKLEWLGYPMVKNFEDMFIHFDRIHECDRHADTQTDGHRAAKCFLARAPPQTPL